MPAARRSRVLSLAVLAGVAVSAWWLSIGGVDPFVPAPHQGYSVGTVAAVVAAGAPIAAHAEDVLIDYPYAGDFDQDLLVGYFGCTTGLTAFSFFSYLILIKLKII